MCQFIVKPSEYQLICGLNNLIPTQVHVRCLEMGGGNKGQGVKWTIFDFWQSTMLNALKLQIYKNGSLGMT